MFTSFGKINEGVTAVIMDYFLILIYSNIIHPFTYLVLEFLLIPVPLFKQLFMDSTGDVVIALNDIENFEWT
jgi:hypothetical protein